MMNEELAILRNSTHLQRDKVSGTSRKDSSERSSDENSKITKLEEANSKFRELLEQSSKELRQAQIETQRITSAVPSPDQNLLNEIEVLKSELCQNKVVIAEQASTIARLEKEVVQLSKTIEVVKKEAEETVRTYYREVKVTVTPDLYRYAVSANADMPITMPC
jgi:flagellar biosynthesis chaperone FliJ